MSELACNWDHPGADRYTGTVASAIAAYGLPLSTQTALITAFERREFTDTVYIDRDTIRGQRYGYEPELRAMHFGSRGRICDRVSRTGWSADHVEAALVICADDACIAIPAVCTNVSLLTRRPEPDRPAERPVVPVGPEPLNYAPPSAGPLTEPTSFDPSPSYATAYYTDRPLVYWPATYIGPTFMPIVPAVPEPSTYALMALGVLVVGARLRSRV